MNTRNRRCMPLAFIIIVVLASCTDQSTATSAIPPSTSQPPQATLSSPVPTNTSTQFFLNTPRPTYTHGPTWTPRPILTRTPTATRMPTLSIQDQEARLLSLLENNNGCTFPCFWGIIPSQTSFEEVKALMREVGAYRADFESVSTNTRHDFDIKLISQESYLLAMTVEFLEDTRTGLILGETVSIRLDWVKPEWRDALRVYYLNEILSVYGTPSYVTVDAGVFHGDPGSTYYAITMYYEDLDFGIQFVGRDAQVTENSLVICPRYISTSEITIYFKVSALEKIYISSLGSWPPGEMLEDISTITLFEFVNMFGNDVDEKSCISSSKELWPK